MRPDGKSDDTEIIEHARNNALKCYYNKSECKDFSLVIKQQMYYRKRRLDQYCQGMNLYQHNNFQQLPKHAFVYDEDKSLLGLGQHKRFLVLLCEVCSSALPSEGLPKIPQMIVIIPVVKIGSTQKIIILQHFPVYM